MDDTFSHDGRSQPELDGVGEFVEQRIEVLHYDSLVARDISRFVRGEEPTGSICFKNSILELGRLDA